MHYFNNFTGEEEFFYASDQDSDFTLEDLSGVSTIIHFLFNKTTN